MKTQTRTNNLPQVIGTGAGIGGGTGAAIPDTLPVSPTHTVGTATAMPAPSTLLPMPPEPAPQPQADSRGYEPQERGVFFAWLVFHAFGVIAMFGHWYHVKRMCAWCVPQRWIGGNPFAKKQTHGVCLRCRAKWQMELAEKSALRTPHSAI